MTPLDDRSSGSPRERFTIAHVASEMAPLAKVGGLADVVGALAHEQARLGHRVTVVIPRYHSVDPPRDWVRRDLGASDVPWGLVREPARFELWSSPEHDLRVLLVGHEGGRRFFDRAGIYDDPGTGKGYTDGAERFLFFSRAALEGLKLTNERFDVVHAHDHQAAWTMCFLRTHEAYHPAFSSAGSVFTIHNLGYQGIHDSWVLGLAGFGGELFYPASPFEFWGRVNYMKVGLAFADQITAVSPRYAREIQSSDEFGFGLEGVLARRSADLHGVLNGMDQETWNPETDELIAARYSARCLDHKAENRTMLVERSGFSDDDKRPVIGMISRLAEQKGFALLEDGRDALTALEARFVVLGTGSPRYEEFLRRLAADRPKQFHFRAGHDERFAHLIEAGADMFLMPSRYEPCGLNQMYSLRYGTPPVVREVGGLADTVTEFDPRARTGTGFLFQRFDSAEMIGAVRRALSIQRQPALWRVLQQNGMASDFSWARSVDTYDGIYRTAVDRVATGRVMTLDAARAMI